MWPSFLNINGLNINPFGLAIAFIFIFFSFYIWRTTKDEYAESDILSFTLVLTIVLVLSFVGWRWWSIGGMFLSGVLTLTIWSRSHKWDAWEWLDVLVPLSLFVGAFACFAWGPELLLAGGLLTIGGVTITFLKRYYRGFSWYKSGKMGFVGIASFIWWCVAWISIAKWHKIGVNLAGLTIEQWLSIWILIACIITLYLRGGRKVTSDWKDLSKLWQPKTNKKQ